MLHLRVAALVLLVLLAGCGGSLQETQTPETTTLGAEPTTTSTSDTTPPPTETTAAPTTETTRATTATTEASTTESTPTSAVENPWGKRNVTVAVETTANQSRNIDPLVNETLTYWNGNASRYGTYDVTFVSTPNARSADIVVELVRQVTQCGESTPDTAVGCAPVLRPSSTPSDPARVEVVAGYSDESTTRILKHEFGHVLGIEHGREPMPLMEPESRHSYLSQPDATDRALPWQNSTLSVYVSTENRTREDSVREQVERALSYFEAGAAGSVPENVSFVEIDNRSATDIDISFPDAVSCDGERDTEASCGSIWGYSTDTDPALEYFSEARVEVAGIDTEAVGWHVGYWLTYAFGLDEGELPAPFVDADYDDRRDEWWDDT